MRLSITGIVSLACLLSFQPAHAGLLDNIMKKASDQVQRKVEDKVEKEVDKAVDGVLETDGSTQEPTPEDVEDTQTPEANVPPDVGIKNSPVDDSHHPTSAKAIALAVIKLAPEIFTLRPDDQLKELLLQVFPEEGEIRTNEFYWHKNKDALIEKSKRMAISAPTVFEVAPWINNSSQLSSGFEQVNFFNARLGAYDFQKRAFPVYQQQLEIPWLAAGVKSNVGLYQFTGITPMDGSHWVPVDIDRAEELTNQLGGTSQLLAEYSFEIIGVVGLSNLEENPKYKTYARYLDMEGAHGDNARAQLVPYFDIRLINNRIDLYIPKEPVFESASGRLIPKSALSYFTSLIFE